MIQDCRERDFRPVKGAPKWTWDETPFRCLAFYSEGNIVAGLRLFYRKMLCPIGDLYVAGIGGLFTIKDYRNKGIAGLLIQHVLKNTDPSEYALVVANGARRPDSIFTKLGFRNLGPSESRSQQDFYAHSITGLTLCKLQWELEPKDHF